ncbi:putative uncharacterized protein C8orf44, partial [Plecturocebus cupreus]
MLPRLVSNSGAQAIVLPSPPKVLGCQVPPSQAILPTHCCQIDAPKTKLLIETGANLTARMIFKKNPKQGRGQWLTPVIPALWEAEASRSPEVGSSRPAWPT